LVRLAHLSLAAFWVGAAVPAEAQGFVTPEQYLRDATGKTITYRRLEDDTLLGEEQYLGKGRTIWKPAGGLCDYGKVTIEGPAMCFEYDRRRGQACWWPFRHQGRYMARSTNPAGGFVCRAEETNARIGCETSPTS
jgi:hypothetical protein